MKRIVWLAALMAGCSGNGGPATPTPADAAPVDAAAKASCDDDAVPADKVVATWTGGQITYGDLSKRTADQLRAADVEHRINNYEMQAQALDQMVQTSLLEAAATKAGKTTADGKPDVDGLLRAEIEDKTVAPTDQEVTDFYPVVQRQLGGATLEEARPILIQELTRRKQSDAFAAYMEGLKASAGLSSDLPYPDLPRVDVKITPDDPIRGKADAPVTIVQFADYQCYYCNKVQPTIDRVLKEYDGRVRLVYKDFPLPAHSRAFPAAIAAHCAGDQGKYWEMNGKLMANQDNLGDADLQSYAQGAGVDMTKFNACIASGKWDPITRANADEGQRVGVSATPTFFIDGTLVSGAQGYDRFKTIIERELAAKPPTGG